MTSWKSLFFYFFSECVSAHNVFRRLAVLQMATKLNTFSVACALPSEIRVKAGGDWVLWKGETKSEYL